MLRALLKKQALELGAFFFQSGRSGKRRSTGRIVLYALLMVYVVVALCGLFSMTAYTLCGPLVGAGMGWLYFALMGITATALGVVGSVLMAYSGLYQARDNELLLAMPIPAWKILLARMTGIYAVSLLMEAAVLVPAMAVYQVVAGFSAAALVCGVALLLLLPLLAVTLSCLLGWLIARVSARMRRKNLAVLVLSLLGLGAYFWGITRINSLLALLLVNGEAVGGVVRRVLYPFYQMGWAALGSFGALTIFTALVAAAFALTWAILSRGFVRLATDKRGAVRVKYREDRVRVRNLDRALLDREFARFWATPIYALNCGLGSVFLLAGAVMALVKREMLLEILAQIPGLAGAGPLMACAAVGLMAATGTVTAPSISLEGKAVWLLQSLPVSCWQVLRAKLRLHMLLTGIPALLFAAVLCWVLAAGALVSTLTLAFSVLIVLLLGAVGLAANLKLPNLNWTNETVAVKQSASVMVTLFGGWALLFGLVGLYLLAGEMMGDTLFLALATLVVGAGSWGVLVWLRRRGGAIWAALA